MRILLINPPTSKEQLYSEWDLSDVKSYSPPIGLLSIMSYLKVQGHNVAFLDQPTKEQVAINMGYFGPDVVGLTAMTLMLESAAEIARVVKASPHRCVTVLGGPHITALPEETMNFYGEFDYGIIGEGELAFAEFLKRSNNCDCKNLVHRKDGKVYVNPRREPCRNLDDLPFPDYASIVRGKNRLSIFGSKSRRSLGIVTSRGCPGQCTFCDRGVFGRRFRCHSANYVLALMKSLHDRFEVTDFLFYDDLFVANRERLIEFCDTIIKKKLPYTWSCCARVDFLDQKLLGLMKRAGCWLIEYGIESGNQEILNKMNKRITLERIYETVQATRKADIEAKGNFIFGNIGETEQTLRDTVEFACRLPLSYFQHTFLAPLPGSEVWDTASDAGEFAKEWKNCNTFSISFVPTGLTRERLTYWSKVAWRRFYLRPHIIWRELFKGNLWIKLKTFLKTIFR